jgi:hypothetical protein
MAQEGEGERGRMRKGPRLAAVVETHLGRSPLPWRPVLAPGGWGGGGAGCARAVKVR